MWWCRCTTRKPTLADSVYRLHRHLRDQFPFPARITIADNASVDDTPRIAEELAAELDDVRVVRLEQKGRGRALHAVWSTSDAPVLAYMDVDLSTDLAALAPLVASLISGHSDLAIGTRLGRGARVVRGPKREIISRCYNFILKSTLAAGFSDAQCGFKAIRADVAHRLLPHVTDTGWFFDTELLVLAERAGFASTKCRWTGWTTRTAESTSWQPRPPTSRASRGCCVASRRVRFPCKRLRHSWVRHAERPRQAHCCARRCGSRASESLRRLPIFCCS